jgi:hypothetical protein
MANRHRSRPRRGPAGNVLVTGDTGTRAGPQGGAAPGASESGDLDSREFGVPQADIPGGLRHKVNPETTPAKTAQKQLRPADEHKFHGVPPMDFGPYAGVPGVEDDKPPRPEPEPKISDAVPVYQVEGPGHRRMIRKLITEGPQAIAAGTVDPVRIADRDPHRVKFWICNETTASGAGAAGPGVRIGDWETAADLRGLLIPAATIKDFVTQDSVYLTNQSGTAVTVSWGYETEVEASGA